ncbi:uncharacterized protein LOC143599971 [Bidens hawaiensis]|uniref:uncharacterized protein LOC143599971 n=1 Tax=Bidens hawaiensis TaxID=980011 RepID=UPI00404AB5DD
MTLSSSSSSSNSSEEDKLICQAVQTTINFLIDQRRPRAPLFRQSRLRDRKTANETLIRHYFSPDPTYGEESFKTPFRMTRRLFMRLANDLPEHFEYFQQRDDARGHPGFTPTQNITAALRQLAHGVGSDMLDEYLQMAKKTGRDSLNHFCKGVISLYKRRYLRKPTMYDIQRIYEVHSERHGFPEMLGSLDCMHVGWAMCPTAWRGQFHRGDHPGSTIVLEAGASKDLWFWHAFFGVARSNNDLNVIDQSPIFDELIDGVEPPQACFQMENTSSTGTTSLMVFTANGGH